MKVSIVGREEACQTLQSITGSNRPEFVALYGRRRVGKTFLVKQFFSKKKHCFFMVTGIKDGQLSEQLREFSRCIGEVFYGGASIAPATNWLDAFNELTKAIKTIPPNKKAVLFFDELPWMATRNSRLLPALEYYWNQYWSSDTRLKLIICGSSASWVLKNIVNNRGGLHNRVTRKIRLEPLKLIDTKKFLKAQGVQLSNDQILQLYMFTGGIPYYLSYVEKGLSVPQIIEQLAFNENGLLLNEFDNLFASLFDQHEQYVEMVREIAKHRYGIGKRKLLERMGQSQLGKSGLEKLSALEEAGFIISLKPHFHKKRGVYYRVIDEYTLFYLRWIEPIRDTLQRSAFASGNWQELQNTPAWNSWLGYSFEAVCYKHINQIRKSLGISPTAIANSWRYVPVKDGESRGAQIDLLFDRRDDVVSICEIKYSAKKYLITKEYAALLLHKCRVFKEQTKTKKELFIAMVAAHGVKANPYSDELLTGVVALDDLFKEA